MNFTCEDQGHVAVFTIRGDVTAEHVEQLRTAVNDRLKQQVNDFVLDMGHVELIDSKGLEALLWMQEVVSENLGQVRLAGLQSGIEEVLRLTRLGKRFEKAADVDEAVASLRI